MLQTDDISRIRVGFSLRICRKIKTSRTSIFKPPNLHVKGLNVYRSAGLEVLAFLIFFEFTKTETNTIETLEFLC